MVILSSIVVGVNCWAVLSFALFVHVFHFVLARSIIDSRRVEVKKPFLLATLAIILAGVSLVWAK